MKIIAADDNEVVLAQLEATLASEGWEVITARDGAEALALVRAGAARLVVSDWEMPAMNGPDLVRAIRSEDLPGYVYLILLTGHSRQEEIVEGLSAGADDFIAKPFNPAELVARVRTGARILSLETRDVAIFALARLAESRDPETGAHLERVRSYCGILARSLQDDPRLEGQIDHEFVRMIYLTSPLHDIGKVGTPDCVLLKPGRLSEREFEVMKMHTVIAGETLDAALRAFPGVTFLQMARDIALTHHERWDGTGYPAGLAGEAIPLAGRIMALADVYDALTSKRVYKGAYPHETARSMIVAESGTHFDPRVVDAFLRCEAKFIEVLDLHGDAASRAA
ncbi:MAG: response regulator [Phycisphaeraceae bacterium]|nr:response regulator [Phycisphaeraceae bacterium]